MPVKHQRATSPLCSADNAARRLQRQRLNAGRNTGTELTNARRIFSDTGCVVLFFFLFFSYRSYCLDTNLPSLYEDGRVFVLTSESMCVCSCT